MTKDRAYDRHGTGFGIFPIPNRTINTRSSTARVVVFPYSKQNFGTASNVRPLKFSSSQVLHTSDRDEFGSNKSYIEIDSEIDKIGISKNIRSPSASFNISLLPSRNWKYLINPGDWLLIYLYHGELDDYDETTVNMVLCGNVDRVSRVKEKDEETDKTLLRYRVSGRNFGKVFETTEVFFDPYQTNQNILDETLRDNGLELGGSPDDLVKQYLDVFLGPGAFLKTGRTSPLGQWKIPKVLNSIVASSFSGDFLPTVDRSFYDILDQKIDSGLPGYKARQMIGLGGDGNLWEAVKRGSNSLVNEVFCEEIRDSSGYSTPSIVLRPRPYNTVFFDSQFGGNLLLKAKLSGAHTTLQDLASSSFVEIDPAEIIFEDLGMDDHSRFNMIWLSTRNYTNDTHSYYGNQASNGVGLPMILRESIERYGLRRFDNTMEFAYLLQGLKENTADIQIYKAFIAQIYDFYYANHLYEQGTMETSGVLEAELGKCLRIRTEDPLLEPEKIYYIEGYEHNFTSLGKWTTTFTLTRGQFNTSIGAEVFIDQTLQDFGNIDTVNDPHTLVKSKVDR